MRRKLKRWLSGGLAAALILSCVNIAALAVGGENTSVSKPEIMVTELVPDTANVSGADGYEFIELYNPSQTETRDLKDYTIIYYNGTLDYIWTLEQLAEDEIVLAPGETLTVWVRNAAVAAALSTEEFRSFYHMNEDAKVATITAGGMRNSATGTADGCGIRVQKGNTELTRAYYNENGQSQVLTDKAFTFGYSTDGGTAETLLRYDAAPTPGFVEEALLTPAPAEPGAEEPEGETGLVTPLVITEIVPQTSGNVGGSNAYEYAEICNVSDRALSLDDFDIVYHNGSSDAIWPLEDHITLEPGESAVIWCVLQAVITAGTDDDAFLSHWKTATGNDELSLVRGENFTRAICNGLANSGSRTLTIRVKATGEVLTQIAYNGSNGIAADKSVTFTYTDGSVGKIDNYKNDPTPGSVAEGQTVGTYTFVEGPAPAPAAAATQSAGESWHVEAPAPETGLLLNAALFVKGGDEGNYTAYPMVWAGEKLSCDLPYSVTSKFSSFDWYVAFDYGVNTAQSAGNTVAVFSGGLDASDLPELLITELLPNSSNLGGSDAYEFVEVYNNSDRTINLKDYRLYYNNNLDAGANDVLWASFDQDVNLASGQCVVFWIHNGANNSLTVANFNAKFGVNLVENETIFILENSGMSNSAARGLRITTNVGDPIDYVTYNVNGADNASTEGGHADKSITYVYNAGTGASEMVSDLSTPTPGSIPASLVPMQARVTAPDCQPTAVDNTPAAFDNDEGLTFSVTAASAGTAVKTVKLSIRDNTMADEETYNLLREDGDTFTLSLGPEDLLNKRSYTYYFTVSDGFNTVTTERKTTNSSKAEQDAIRFNVTADQWLSGTERIITTGDTLVIGGQTVADTIPSLENTAKFVFEVSQTDTFFKNAVAIGTDVLGIFNEGTYGDWRTYSFDVDAAYFTKGETVTIDIHAGNKSNPLVHDVENNDDFVVRNIRLVLPDGTTLRAADYDGVLGNGTTFANRAYGITEEIKMGDSTATVEILHINFTPADTSFNGIACHLDTTVLPDGALTITGELDGEDRSVTVQIDNTAPSIATNLTDGAQYKGSHQITAFISDAGSGVASRTVTLDGRKIALPYTFASAEMTAGSHTLTVTAVDNCGNTKTERVAFTTPEEAAVITDLAPADGETLSQIPTFAATVTDPTDDTMTVCVKKGERYELGASNMVRSSGISDTAGENNASFDAAANPGDGFPFEQFDITVGENVTASDELNIRWTGETNNAKTFLYVYNTAAGGWDRLESDVTENGDGTVTLDATVSLADRLSGQTIRIMVQNGEGYTPAQYEVGAAAGTPTYSGITTGNENDTPRGQYDFTLAVESDPQYYNEEGGDPSPIGKYQYQLDIHDWLIANRSRMNIQYLFNDGDIVDDMDITEEWVNADAAYALLDNAGFPYGLLAGNHDVGHLLEDYESFCQYFGASRYENNPWYGGSYQDNRGHYDLITVDGIDFLMLYVGWGVGDGEIEWMNEVLARYPERIAILNFHEYLLASGGLGEEPQRVYDEVIAVNPNVRMVLSGHYHNAQTVTYSLDDDGDGQTDRKVYAMLFDYQGLKDGGMGYMRLMHFDCASGTVTVRTYSPSLDDYDAKDYSGIGSDGITGAEELTISFADLGIEPKVKTLTTSGLTVNLYGGETIGSVENVASGSSVTSTWSAACNGSFGWYVEVTDAFGGVSRSDVRALTLDGLSDSGMTAAKLLINQVYGTGDNDDTPISSSFVELYNPTDAEVDLTGYTLVYGGSELPLTGRIPAKGSYLVVGAEKTVSDDTLTYDLPTADQTCDWVINNKTYTITLKNGDAVMDTVAVDGSALSVSKQKSIQRIDHADTDSNTDFRIYTWKAGETEITAENLAQYAPYNSKGQYGGLHGAAAEPAAPAYTPAETADTRVTGYYDATGSLKLELAGRYNSGAKNEDGGSLEIVEYNPANGFAYAVSGVKGKLIAVNLNVSLEGDTVVALSGTEYDVKSLVEGFAYGDMTSVAISPDGGKLAVAIQAEGYADNGVVALFACGSDGSLTLLDTAPVGVQPDMVTFADHDTILTADEGEPRGGANAEDPKGSVSIVTIGENMELTARTVTFDRFDAQRDELTAAGVLVQKDTQPSTDFEPEYIAVSGTAAYISLQEANAIAVLDIASGEFTGVYPLGFQDYSVTQVDLQNNDTIELKNYENVYGIKMPDGIAVTNIGGKTYLLTANEGDSRADWEGLDNEVESKTAPTGNVKLEEKVVWFNAGMWDGLDAGKAYVFGGRSFSIYEVTDAGLNLVYDSGSGFEEVTAEQIPLFFNTSNNKISLDNRSGKKGPEPESVVTGVVDGRTYAFIALERIGGVMVYDITEPENAQFVNYINSREFDAAIQGDVSPEGLCFVSAADSKTGAPVLLTACEVSGTLAVYELTAVPTGADPDANPDPDPGLPNPNPGGSAVTPPDGGTGSSGNTGSESTGGENTGGENTDSENTGSESTGSESAALPFTDVAESVWYYDAVKYVAENGLMNGVAAAAFGPEMTTTRGMIVTILYRLEGEPAVTAASGFTDVPAGQWYTDAVAWAAAHGIVNGYGDGAFGPEDPITREQIAVILYRYCQYKGYDVSARADLSGFADAGQVSAYAADAMRWANAGELITGVTGSALVPQGSATRAMTAAILMRWCENLPF